MVPDFDHCCQGSRLSTMMKILASILVAIVLAEAKFNKYERLKEVFEYIQTNETLLEMYREHLHQHQLATERLKAKRAVHPFTCLNGYQFARSVPTSVHQLRPEHITVVAAMGDSLTAGNGILGSNVLDCLTEYRGRSWSIGGDNSFDLGVETLPNILKKYSPHLMGYALGKCKSDDYGCANLNVAVAGQTSQEMPAQARELVSRLQNPNFGVNYQNDWKVITLFIGGNDLCDYCHNSNIYSPTSYINKIREALDILHANVPRAFVNLVQIFDITPLASVAQGFFCNVVTNMVCDCARDSSNNHMLQVASHAYQDEITKLVASGRYDTRDDFTVVLQPFFKDTEPVKLATGQYDLAYFAPDCFHFSELGTYAAAKSLWNNMIEPPQSKQSRWFVHEPFHCPHTHGASDSLFRTYKN